MMLTETSSSTMSARREPEHLVLQTARCYLKADDACLSERAYPSARATSGEIERWRSLSKKHLPSMEMLRLVNSGTEAVMSAIRAARGFHRQGQDRKIRGLLYDGHSDGLLVKGRLGTSDAVYPDRAQVCREGCTKDTTLLAKVQ